VLPVSTTGRFRCHANFIFADRVEGSMAKFLGNLRKFRCLAVPLLVGVIGAVTAAGMVETRAERAATCGLAIHVQDPDLRASLASFERHQSAAARKVCAFHWERR
jgi:hypothetical protein